MSQTAFEKALAFYADLDTHLEALPSHNAIFPFDTPTTYAIEKQMLVDKKRREGNDETLPATQDAYWMGLNDSADAGAALRLKEAMDDFRESERDAVILKAEQLRHEMKSPVAFVFHKLAKEFADKPRMTKQSREKQNRMQSEESSLMQMQDTSRGLYGGMHVS